MNKSPLHGLLIAIGLSTVSLLGSVAFGQEIPELAGPFGGQATADILGEAKETRDGVLLQAASEGWTFRFIPGHISGETATLSGGTLQAGFRDLQIDFRYLNLSPDDADSIGQARAQFKYKVRDQAGGPKISLLGLFTDLENVYDQLTSVWLFRSG